MITPCHTRAPIRGDWERGLRLHSALCAPRLPSDRVPNVPRALFGCKGYIPVQIGRLAEQALKVAGVQGIDLDLDEHSMSHDEASCSRRINANRPEVCPAHQVGVKDN